MGPYRDEAIVLRTQKLGEADRIITLLTRSHGKVRAVAKGVRRTTSRLGARVEPFMRTDMQLHPGRSLDIVTQVDTTAAYGAVICEDYELYTAGSAMLETADRVVDAEHEPARAQFQLLAGALSALSGRAHGAASICDSYILRALAAAGWAPSLDACVRCGAPGPHHWFSVAQGGVVCEECRRPGAVAIQPSTGILLAALLTGDWPVVDCADARSRGEASGIVAAYSQYYLERSLRSLPLVERSRL